MCLNFVDCVLVEMSFEFGDRMSNRVLLVKMFVELVLFLMFGLPPMRFAVSGQQLID